MQRVDLTPRSYHSQGRARGARVLWAFVTVASALLAAVPIGLEATRAPDPASSVAGERLVQAENRRAQIQDQFARAQTQLETQRRELKAEEHLTRRPDWSTLLRLVAGAFDERLMMTGMRMGTPRDATIRTALSGLGGSLPDASVWLMIQGVAESNRDVPDLILRMEGLGLFDRVVLAGTRREPYAGGDRTVFILVCRLD